MKLRISRIPVILIIATGFFMFSCTDFFTSTWFPWAARDQSSLIPKITLDNIDELLQMFEDDPDGSYALLQKLKDSKGGLSDDEWNELLGASLGAAANAVGFGQAVIGAAGNIGNIENLDGVQDVLLDALNSLSNVEGTGDILSEILPPPGTEAFDTFTDNASSEDLAVAAMILVLGEVSKAVDGDFEDFLDNPGNYEIPPDTQALAQAMAIVAVLADRPGSLDDDSPLKGILDLFKLLD